MLQVTGSLSIFSLILSYLKIERNNDLLNEKVSMYKHFIQF